MPITLGSNIASLSAQRRLAEGTSQLAKTYERLSSGLRINHASDDAAGLSIVSTLNAKSRVFAQSIKNVNDGLSFLAIANGSLSEMTKIVTRIQELAEQSANGTYSTAQREALDREGQALRTEFNRIYQTTSFNGVKTLDAGQIKIQAGGNEAAPLAIGTTLDNNTSAVYLDGVNDYVEVSDTAALEYRGGEFTVEAWINLDAGETQGDIVSKAWNSLGDYNYRLSLNGGLLQFGVTGLTGNYITAGAVSTGVWHHVAGSVAADGTMRLFLDGVQTGTANHGTSNWNAGNGDTNINLAIGTLYPYGDFAWSQPTYSIQGKIDEVRISNSTRYTANFAVPEAEFIADSSTVGLWHFDEGSGGIGTVAVDSSGNGRHGVTRNSTVYSSGYDFPGALGIFSLKTQSDALITLEAMKSMLNFLTSESGKLGAQESVLAIELQNLAVARENFEAAAARISNADIAEEAANLTAAQIKQRVTASVLAQANQQPALALKLLGGV